MAETIRLTTAQALIKFLNQQYISIDGVETPFVEGIFNVFGHGNVLGIGQALEENPGHLKVIQGKNEQGMTHAAVAYAKQMKRQKIYAVTASAAIVVSKHSSSEAMPTVEQIEALMEEQSN